MKIEQKESSLLINEWQLGQQLNTAVHNGTREKFNLLLSFLSDDARDFAQFSPSFEVLDNEASKSVDLRSDFSLEEAQPLVNKGMSLEQAKLLSDNLEKDNLSSIRLQLLLKNEAILSRSEKLIIDSDVSDNLSLLLQQRLSESLLATKQLEEVPAKKVEGINHQLMTEYQSLDLDNKPIQVTYM